jgi:hypothetical protein
LLTRGAGARQIARVLPPGHPLQQPAWATNIFGLAEAVRPGPPPPVCCLKRERVEHAFSKLLASESGPKAPTPPLLLPLPMSLLYTPFVTPSVPAPLRFPRPGGSRGRLGPCGSSALPGRGARPTREREKDAFRESGARPAPGPRRGAAGTRLLHQDRACLAGAAPGRRGRRGRRGGGGALRLPCG